MDLVQEYDSYSREFLIFNKQTIVKSVLSQCDNETAVNQLSLLKFLKKLAPFRLSTQETSIFWNCIYDIISLHPSTLYFINTLLLEIFSDHNTIRNMPKAFPSNESRLISALKLLFLYNPHTTVNLLDKMFEKFSDETILALGEVFCDLITDEQHKLIFDWLENGDDKLSRYTSVAPILVYTVDYVPAAESAILSVLKTMSEYNIQYFAILLHYVAPIAFKNKRPFVLSTFVQQFTQSSPYYRELFDAFRSALRFEMIGNICDLDLFLELTYNVHPDYLLDYIRSFEDLVAPLGSDDYMLTHVIDFIRDILSDDEIAIEVQASLFPLINTIADKDDVVAFILRSEIIRRLPEALESDNIDVLSSACKLMYLCADIKLDPLLISDVFPDALRRALKFASNREDGKAKQIGLIGEYAAGTIHVLNLQSHLNQMFDIIMLFLQDDDEIILTSGAQMILAAGSMFKGIHSDVLMKMICEKAKFVNDHFLFNSFISALVHLGESTDFPVTVLQLCYDILDNELKITEFEHISYWDNMATHIFTLFSRVIIQLRNKASMLITKLLNLLTECITSMVELVAEPIMTALILDLVDDKKSAYELLKQRSVQAHSVTVLDFVFSNVRYDQELADHISTAYEQDGDDSQWTSTLALYILRLHDLGLDVKEETLVSAISSFPPDESLGILDEFVYEILKVAENEMTHEVMLAVAHSLFEFTGLSQESIREQNISAKTIDEVRGCIKHILISTPIVHKVMARGLKYDEPRVERLESLIR